MDLFSTYIYPVLSLIITLGFGFIWKEVGPLVKDFVILKIGISKDQQEKIFSSDAWNIAEEYYRLNPIIGDTIQAKIKMYETEITKKIPGITPERIEDLRQSLAGIINKDKPIAAAATTKTVIQAVEKFYNKEGIELKPVENKTPVDGTTTNNAAQEVTGATLSID